MTKSVAVAALAAILLLGCERAPAPAPSAAPNPAPPATAAPAATTAAPSEPRKVEFSLTDMEGKVRHSSEWAGKPQLVNFWATWCAPCRREIPLLIEAQDAHSDIDLQVLGIAMDFPEDVAAYAAETPFNYPILVGQEDAMAVAETSGIEFIGLPFTLVVAPSGDLIKAHIGEIREDHIAAITAVLGQLDRGELDLSGAQAALGPL